MTGPDERCVGAIWVALALRSPLEDEGSVLCPDVKHRGGSHGAEVNVLFLRRAVRGRKTERPLPSPTSPLTTTLCPRCQRAMARPSGAGV